MYITDNLKTIFISYHKVANSNLQTVSTFDLNSSLILFHTYIWKKKKERYPLLRIAPFYLIFSFHTLGTGSPSSKTYFCLSVRGNFAQHCLHKVLPPYLLKFINHQVYTKQCPWWSLSFFWHREVQYCFIIMGTFIVI